MNLAYNILNSLGNGFGEGGMAKVDLRGITEMPTKFELYQNYPNPFNPSTFIKYSLPEISNVKLEIYNIMGQKVITLVDGILPAGYHHASWNGKSDKQTEIASGIYICILKAESVEGGKTFTDMRKMVLVK